jgi:hypothetical protein
MPQTADFQRNAEEAERRAKRAASEVEREAYLKIAKGWRDLMVNSERRKRDV